jgi:cytidine deaminase
MEQKKTLMALHLQTYAEFLQLALEIFLWKNRIMNISEPVKKAYQIALKTRENSYSPYSNFKVGAAVKIKNSDLIIGGCNVENSSYGGAVCAERNAVFSSITQHNEKEFEFIVIVTKTKPASLPCGFCLQVLSEFCDPNFEVYLANLDEIEKKVLFKDLLPHPFDKTSL